MGLKTNKSSWKNRHGEPQRANNRHAEGGLAVNLSWQVSQVLSSATIWLLNNKLWWEYPSHCNISWQRTRIMTMNSLDFQPELPITALQSVPANKQRGVMRLRLFAAITMLTCRAPSHVWVFYGSRGLGKCPWLQERAKEKQITKTLPGVSNFRPWG